MEDQTLQISTLGVMLLASLVIPILVGLVTKVNASATIKFVCNAILSTAAAVLANAVTDDGSAVISLDTAVKAGVTCAISITTYLGIYKPNNLNNQILPKSGIGPSSSGQ